MNFYVCTHMDTYLSFGLFHLPYFVLLQNAFVMKHFMQVCNSLRLVHLYFPIVMWTWN